MDAKAAELMETLKELQTTNRFILRRLNRISDQDGEVCTCDCHSKQESKDVMELKSKVQRMEEANERRDGILKNFGDGLKEIQQSVRVLKDKAAKLPSIPARPLKNVSPKVGVKAGANNEHEIGEQYYTPHKDASQAKQDTSGETHIESTKQDRSLDMMTHKEAIAAKVDSEMPTDHKDTAEINRKIQEQSDSKVDKQTSASVSTGLREVQTGSKPVMVYRVEREEGVGNPLTGGGASQAASGTQAVSGDLGSSKSDTQIHKPQVIHQPHKAYKHELAWELMFSHEIDEGKRQVRDVGGVHLIICLDISESMACDGAWQQARRFYMDLMKGLIKMRSEEKITDEHVALVTFGHETRVVKRLTNQYEEVRDTFDSLRLGGPSPLYGGLKMSIAAAGSSEKQICFVNAIKVNTKILLITDGNPTARDLVEGPDEVDCMNKDEVTAGNLQIMEDIAKYNLDFFCVPVGKANMEFLNLVVAIPDGKCLKYTEGEKFSRRTYLTLKAGTTGHSVMGMLGASGLSSDIQEYMAKNMPSLSDGNPLQMMAGAQGDGFGTLQQASLIKQLEDLSPEDLEHMKEITDRAQSGVIDFLRKSSDNDEKYQDSDKDVLPPLGTRVRRGPDWSWHDQDHWGPGTVIGHIPERNHIWVEWDNDGKSYYYHYGGAGRYDVLPVDNEPRRLAGDGKIQVGCVVKPGKDWHDTKAQRFDRGVVLRLLTKSDVNVRVRWNNGKKGDYAHNYKGKCEVEFSEGFGESSSAGVQPLKKTEPVKKKNKNKNKNKNA